MTEPYYSDDLVQLFHGDCRELTAWLEADAMVVDPPYGRAWRQGEIKDQGSARGHARNAASQTGIANDNDTTVRDDILALWGTDRRAVVFGDLMLPPPPGAKLVGAYRKPADAGLRGAMGGVRRDLEAIYLLGPWPSGIGGRSSLFTTAAALVGTLNGIVAKAGGHPHTKPQDVLSDLIALTEGSVIADPSVGSGSTLVAAKSLGLRAIGVELEERYCEIAARRLAQDTLFGGIA
ncbi:DNA methyltransferase [Nocardioides sp. NPDC057772]|uniref:DNA methyltransferase n=1 Tax=Nocardioides sp. NPDC057772 TaxID=3346245 RepID=UPI00366F480C